MTQSLNRFRVGGFRYRTEDFCEQWVQMLTQAMARTGNGYRRHSLRNTGVDADRRKDKLDPKNQPRWLARYRNRYAR